jgi:hypothetical protein
MRSAFKNEVEHSYLYQQLPIRKDRKQKFYTPKKGDTTDYKNSSVIKSASRSRSKSRMSAKRVEFSPKKDSYFKIQLKSSQKRNPAKDILRTPKKNKNMQSS